MIILGLTLAALIGLSLGLLGGGGSILTVPIFVYVLGYAPKESIAMGLAVVGATSLFGAAEPLARGQRAVQGGADLRRTGHGRAPTRGRGPRPSSRARSSSAVFAAVMLVAACFMFRNAAAVRAPRGPGRSGARAALAG